MKKILGGLLVMVIGTGVGLLILIFIGRHQVLTPVGDQEVVLRLTNELSNRGITIFGLPIVQGDEITASISGKRVIFSRDKDIPSQVRALQLILPRLKMDAGVLEVDLRFNKVVLR